MLIIIIDLFIVIFIVIIFKIFFYLEFSSLLINTGQSQAHIIVLYVEKEREGEEDRE